MTKRLISVLGFSMLCTASMLARTPESEAQRGRQSQPTCRLRGSGVLPTLPLVSSRGRRDEIELVGFEAELDLGPFRGARANTQDVRVLAPMAFQTTIALEALEHHQAYLDGGFRAFDGALHIVETADGEVVAWDANTVELVLDLEPSTLTVRLPCNTVRWGEPARSVSASHGLTEPGHALQLQGIVHFRKAASQSSPVIGRADVRGDIIPGEIVATASDFSLVQLRSRTISFEGWVPSDRVCEAGEWNPGMGGLGLRGSEPLPMYRLRPEVGLLDVWLEPRTAIYFDEHEAVASAHVSERVHVLLALAPNARRAAIHAFVGDDTPCERMIEASRARCSETAARERNDVVRYRHGTSDSTVEDGYHVFYVDAP
jgi:hypothetical protein